MKFTLVETGAILSTALAIKKNATKLTNVPLLVKIAHFAFVGLFCIIGIDGFKILIYMCFHHAEFITAFSNPNPLGISSSSLEYIGWGFSLMGAALCIASLKLCALRTWARRIITSLALPYCILYPSILMTVSPNEKIHHFVQVAQMETALFSVLAVAAILFYRSKYVAKHLIFAA
jgi:hypothetical protein